MKNNASHDGINLKRNICTPKSSISTTYGREKWSEEHMHTTQQMKNQDI